MTLVRVVISSRCVYFQAEVGIRDLVRSRGLGEVYKIQGELRGATTRRITRHDRRAPRPYGRSVMAMSCTGPVSYTHLTMPTSDLV